MFRVANNELIKYGNILVKEAELLN